MPWRDRITIFSLDAPNMFWATIWRTMAGREKLKNYIKYGLYHASGDGALKNGIMSVQGQPPPPLIQGRIQGKEEGGGPPS